MNTEQAETEHVSNTPVPHQAPSSCPNCHAPLYGPWCFRCGQSQKPIDRFFFSLLSEAFDDVFSWDSRTERTLAALLFKPGFLTTEYFAGRRARYVPPLRLYLITSVVFFFVLSFQTLLATSVPGAAGTQATIKVQIEHDQAGDNWREDLQDGLGKINLDWLTPDANEALRNRLKAQAAKAVTLFDENPGEIADAILDVAPPVMFLLLPLFALLLKIVYFTSRRYYTEHLVLAVHNHSFLFLVFLLDALLAAVGSFWAPAETFGDIAVLTWVPAYMYFSLMRVFKQGWFVTFLKFTILGISYVILFNLALGFAFLLGVMTL